MTSTLSDFLPKVTSLEGELTQVLSKLATETVTKNFFSRSREAASLAATLTYIANEQVLQTATDTPVIESASFAVAEATAALSSIYEDGNIYGMHPSFGGNLAMTVVMGIFFVSHTVLGIWSRQWWFGVSYFCGAGLEMSGYIGRTLSAHDPIAENPFLLQIICLTIAPVFIMAGIYYLLAQLIVIYGKQYAMLKPMYYSYIFITCDVISLVIQAAGGGIAATSIYESSANGTHIMVAGLAFQVFSMSIFIFLLFDFFKRIKFGSKGHRDLEPLFEPKFKHLRSRWLFRYFPYAITFGIIFVYIRCIYRVVELAEGWSGYLITHEIYFMILDALMMALTCLTFIPFHPGLVYGKGEDIHASKSHKNEKNVDSCESKETDDVDVTDNFIDQEQQLGEKDIEQSTPQKQSRWKGLLKK